jgi:hypothetical protein
VHPWDRRQDEPSKAHAGLLAYLELPPQSRSIAKAAKALGVPTSTAKTWSAKFQWGSRADAHAAYLARKAMRATEDSTVRDARRAAKSVSALLTVALEEARKLIVQSKGSDDSIASPKVVVELVHAAVKLQRLIAGESTENVDVVERVDLTKLSDEEFAAYEALSKKIGGGSPVEPIEVQLLPPARGRS